MTNFLRHTELYSNQWEASKSLYVKEIFEMIKRSVRTPVTANR